MDKIDTANWNNYFSDIAQTTLHVSQRYSETKFQLKEPGLPSGKIRALTTPGAILTELYLEAERPFQLNETEPKESAESVFVLKGNVESQFPYFKAPLHFGSQNHSMQYSDSFNGNHTIQSGNFHALTITYDLSYLTTLLQSDDNGSLQELSRKLFRRENFLTVPGLNWNGRIAEVIDAILQCRFHGLTGYVFIESKMMELFVLQMEQSYALQSGGHPKETWSKADREKIFAVREYIEQAYLEPLTFNELTRKFELNEFKLKKGFRYFFQTTVFGHILHLRMQKAKSLLKEQQMNVSEVAYFIGYDNMGSFSAEFKKRFGHSPSKW